MTEDQRRDREVHGWVLAEGSVRAPDRLREAVRAEIAETRQERFVSSVPAWLAAMPMRAAAAILVLVLGVGSVGFLVGRVPAGIGTPTAPPASPTPSPTASASPEPTPAGMLLSAGAAASQVFRPAVRFRVPAGWHLQADEPDLMNLVPPGAGWMRQGDGAVSFDSVTVYARPMAGQPDGTLTGVEGVGRTAEELATWLSRRPQLTASTPVLDSMAGRPAQRLDFELSPEAGDLWDPLREPARRHRQRRLVPDGDRGSVEGARVAARGAGWVDRHGHGRGHRRLRARGRRGGSTAGARLVDVRRPLGTAIGRPVLVPRGGPAPPRLRSRAPVPCRPFDVAPQATACDREPHRAANGLQRDHEHDEQPRDANDGRRDGPAREPELQERRAECRGHPLDLRCLGAGTGTVADAHVAAVDRVRWPAGRPCTLRSAAPSPGRWPIGRHGRGSRVRARGGVGDGDAEAAGDGLAAGPAVALGVGVLPDPGVTVGAAVAVGGAAVGAASVRAWRSALPSASGSAVGAGVGAGVAVGGGGGAGAASVRGVGAGVGQASVSARVPRR